MDHDHLLKRVEHLISLIEQERTERERHNAEMLAAVDGFFDQVVPHVSLADRDAKGIAAN